jgi:hypothetical protein
LPPNLTATHFLDEFLETQRPHGTQTRRRTARAALFFRELSEVPLTAMLHRVTIERTLEIRALNIIAEIHGALAITVLARAEVQVHVHRICQFTFPASFAADRTRFSSPSRPLISELITPKTTFTRYESPLAPYKGASLLVYGFLFHTFRFDEFTSAHPLLRDLDIKMHTRVSPRIVGFPPTPSFHRRSCYLPQRERSS